MKIAVDFDLPSMPNFIRVTGGKEFTIDVADLSPEQLTELAQAWSRELVAHAKLRRDQRQRDNVEALRKR